MMTMTTTTTTKSFEQKISKTLGKIFTRKSQNKTRKLINYAAQNNSNSSNNDKFVTKICGVTNEECLQKAIDSGCTHVGMILWPKSKRSVSREIAKTLAKKCLESDVIPVAVFVDERAEEIEEICKEIGVKTAQLHGDFARKSLKDIPLSINVIWAISVDCETGEIMKETLPRAESDEEMTSRRSKMLSGEKGWRAPIDWVNGPRKTIDYILIDGIKAGSGERVAWEKLEIPRGCSRKGWILAGGLNAENCSEAIMLLRPNGVDCASGVSDENGVLKDFEKCKAFVKNCEMARTKTLQ